MTLTFLCSAHRDWVYFHPEEALTSLDESQSKGELLMQSHSWQEATTYLGCAFETTEILMELQGIEKSFLLGRLTALAIYLADSFSKLNAVVYQNLVLDQAEQKLQAAAAFSSENQDRLAFIQRCILTINTYKQQINLTEPPAKMATPIHIH